MTLKGGLRSPLGTKHAGSHEESVAAPLQQDPLPVTMPQSLNTAGTPHLADILQPERNSFGLIRLIAALAVVVSHSFHLAGAPESAEPLARLTGYSLGTHAVHVFFTISGVLIAASLMRSQSLWAYGRARALRLLPGLIVCVLVTAVVLGPLVSDVPWSRYLLDSEVLRYATLTVGLITANAPLPGVFHHNAVPDIVNLPLWTLKYETLCYLGLALMGVAGLMRSARLTSLALAPLMLAWVVLAAFPALLPVDGAPVSLLRLAFSFGLGTLAYVWRERLPIHWFGVAGAWLLMALALGTRIEGPVEQIFVAYLAVWAASLPTGWLGSLTRKTDLSYGVYIYDWPIAQALVRFVPGLSQPLLLMGTLALVLPVAALSWMFIEKPALGWKRRTAGEATQTISKRVRLALRGKSELPASDPLPSKAELEPSEPAFPLEGPARERFSRIIGLRAAAVLSPEPIPAGL